MNLIGLILGSVALVVPVLAGPVGVLRTGSIAGTQNRELVDELASAKQNAQRQAFIAAKGQGATEYRFKALELDDLIGRIQRGEQVPAKEIDRALRD